MKTNTKIEGVKFYFKELTIVTVGVLIALFLSNLKEYNQAKKYHNASIETITSEVKSNQFDLNGVIEKQNNLLDTIISFKDSHYSIYDLLKKNGGLQFANISNTGIEFYKKNQINSIDFKIMSKLILMNMITGVIDKKLDKLIDYMYANIYSDSKESKQMIIMYLRDVLDSENQLIKTYEDFMNENIALTNSKK